MDEGTELLDVYGTLGHLVKVMTKRVAADV